MAFLDDNGLLYFWLKIKSKLAGKVDVVAGKGLSTNDYTTEEKTKLSGLKNYTLPTASDTVLGGVKIGSNLSVNSSGVLSATNTTYGVATSSTNGLMSGADKSKLDTFGSASSYALKSDITNMYKYKGSVATVSQLPTTSNITGDVYNVESNGMNYAWNGTEWDSLGEIFNITTVSNAEIDTIVAS